MGNSKLRHKYAKAEAAFAPQASPFLRLPGEIRTQIYRAALLKRDAIDLWPASTIFDPSTHPALTARINKRTSNALHFRHQHDLQYVRSELAIALLGACRQIRMEAASIFWGENQFRFSTDFEWTGLRRFLTTIGPEARSRIETIEVAPPETLCFVNTIIDRSSFYDPTPMKNHPKLRMAKLYSDPIQRRGQGAALVRTVDNIAFVCHLLSEERALKTLNLVVPAGFKLAQSSVCLNHLNTSFHALRFLRLAVVLEPGSEVHCNEAIAFLTGAKFAVNACPGALIKYQLRAGHAATSGPSLMVTEQTIWSPPAEDKEDYMLEVQSLFDESAAAKLVGYQRNERRSQARLPRILKGFGGCRFVERNGTFCNDCNQSIIFDQHYYEHRKKYNSPCIRCHGKGGMRYINGIELRKQTRERRKNASTLEDENHQG